MSWILYLGTYVFVCRTALQREIATKVVKLDDVVRNTPLVLKLVVTYNRHGTTLQPELFYMNKKCEGIFPIIKRERKIQIMLYLFRNNTENFFKNKFVNCDVSFSEKYGNFAENIQGTKLTLTVRYRYRTPLK